MPIFVDIKYKKVGDCKTSQNGKTVFGIKKIKIIKNID